ncbi:MAG: hypothetical protein O9972_09610 [Burkholderiales bacterium]|nr:hypothetical protein [Burkholderiales bacterium]
MGLLSERLREGDIVVLHAKVNQDEAPGGEVNLISLVIVGDECATMTLVDRGAIVSIARRHIQVGDIVYVGPHPKTFEVLAIHGDDAWVAPPEGGAPSTASIFACRIHTRASERSSP